MPNTTTRKADEILMLNADFAEPTAVLPKNEVLKKAERALSGKMSVDFINEKTGIEILWDIVNEAELGQLKAVFEYYKTLDVTYRGQQIKCYVDTFEYTPFFTVNELCFRDVKISLVQI